MRHVQARRHYLEQLITGEVKPERGALKACTLVGSPKKELVERYKKGGDRLVEWLNEQRIEFKWGPYESTSVCFYFPSNRKGEFLPTECYVTVENPTLSQINRIIETSFDELLDVYEVDLPLEVINRITGVAHPEEQKISFETILFLLKAYSQTDIATFINRSSQTVCDLKKGRAKPTTEVLQSLMKEFPLLPWQSLIMLLDLS